MPFITDPTWTPSRYRVALRAWNDNAPAKESDLLPRQSLPTEKPRHQGLSVKLRSLLAWRTISSGSDWTVIAANDNVEDDTPAPIDSEYTIRPRISDIRRAIKGVTFEERRHAKLGGGGLLNVVAVFGDIETASVASSSLRPRRDAPDCIIRLGQLEFSNGAKEESALVRDPLGKITRGSVRIPLGGITRFSSGHRGRPQDGFGKPKGADNDNHPEHTVGSSGNTNSGAFDFCDPLADWQEMRRVRKAVKPATADILDFALRAANFREIGERLGHTGKHAERQGKAALIAACEELEIILAA